MPFHDTPLTGTIPYSPEEALNLRGSNQLSAKEAFYERKKYKVLPLFLDTPTPLHSWYTALYYGRVDPIQNGIVVKPQGPVEWGNRQTAKGITTYEPNRRNTLKQVKSTAGNVFVLNFVADAYEDLKNHLERVGDAQLINTGNSVYYKLEAVKGVENYQTAFEQLEKGYGQRYSSWIRSQKKRAASILDFPSFVKELPVYMGTKIDETPVTLTGYVVSKFSSPMISGLSIELKKDPDYATDSPKWDNYILDPNFKYFVRAARKYGFYVDRNGPWKITADLLSEPMLRYMTKSFSPTCEQIGGYFDAPSEYGIFDAYYYKTYKLDLAQLKKTLREMYNKLAEDHPRIKIETDATVRCPNQPAYEIKGRYPVTHAQVEELGSLFWLHMYFKIRSAEANVQCTDYDQKVRMINDIYNSYGEERAMRYINNLIKPYVYNLSVGKKALTTRGGPVKIGDIEGARSAPTHVGARTTDGGSSY